MQIKPLNRRREFRIETRLLEKDGKRQIVKSAADELAQPFLENILRCEAISEIFFRDVATVIKGSLVENKLYYPFVEASTLENLIAEEMKKGGKSSGIGLVSNYLEMIKRLPSKCVLPVKFMNEFGIYNSAESTLLDCLTIGPIDFVPCNILVDDEKWYVIDHEWTCEFPVPREYIIFRGIYSLIVRLQQDIKLSVCAEQPVVLFSGFGKNRTYIPVSWLELMHIERIPLQRLAYWEFLFQRKVKINAKFAELRLPKNPKPKKEIGVLSGLISDLIYAPKILKRELIRFVNSDASNTKNS